MRIVFLGTGEIGVPSLRALVGAHEVVGVFTQPDRAVGRHQSELQPSPIKAAALTLGLPVFQPARLRAAGEIDVLRHLGPEIIVVVAYGQILTREVLDLPPLGCLNVHASLLPRHRGASPIQAAILSGDRESGVTIMQMDVGLDTGDMLLKSSTPIGRHETGGQLHDRLAGLAPAPLLDVLASARSGTLQPEPQDESLTTYARKIAKSDGLIDWSRPAVEIARQIRAYNPWPSAFTSFVHAGQTTVLKVHQGLPIRLHRDIPAGTILAAHSRGILVAAGEGSILLREVQAAGAKRLSASDFLRGRPLVPGERLGA